MTTATESTPTLPTQIALQVPLWPDDVRGLPNAFARSALFCIGGRSPRRQLQNALIATVRGAEVRYKGEELRQDDSDFFMQLVHLARGYSAESLLTEPICLTPYSMLKAMSWPQSKVGYERLRACADRLKVNALKVKFQRNGELVEFSGSMIRKSVIPETSTDGRSQARPWQLWLEPEIVKLFGVYSFSQIEWAQRTELKRPLAKWLHSFLTDLGLPSQPIFIEDIRQLSGSQCKELSAFKQMLQDGLAELKKVAFVLDWKFDGGTVYVQRATEHAITRIRTTNRLIAQDQTTEEVEA